MESAKLENAKPPTSESPGVDLCIMLDCTGSMSTYIQMSKDKIQDIMANVKESYPKSEIRVAIVAYRDIEDKNRHEMLPFTESSEKAKTFLKGLRAEGGGDAPEDVNGAFQIALYKITWQNPVRLLVHIADAPCHGKEFHNCYDNHPKGHQSDASWDKIFKSLVELRLDYLFLKILDMTDQMFTKFKKMAIKQGSEENELSFEQESANSQAKGKKVGGADGGRPAVSHEDHFAKTIADKVKSCVGKELKKGFERKLEKRTTGNAELVEGVKKSVASIVQKFDFEQLKSKYNDLSAKVGECILSSNNFIEALKDEDCLCLTFNIGRSQAAIVDPSQIIIKDVYPSFLTAGSFFYSTEFALKKNKLAHGGYEKNAEGLIIKGAAQEDITGVMPLYFCEENWQVAKLLMKLTMGWAVTLEPAGYMYEQLKIVPFMILAKLAQMLHEKPESQFLQFQFELVKQTCMQIMKDGSHKGSERKFDEDVIGLYQQYVEKTSVRTIDSIANNTAFLAQLYIAKECGMLFSTENEYFDQFLKGLLEEETRRRLYPLDETINVNQWILELLNVDVEKLVTEPVEAYKNIHAKKINPIYEDFFLDELKNFRERQAQIKAEKEILERKKQKEKETTEEFKEESILKPKEEEEIKVEASKPKKKEEEIKAEGSEPKKKEEEIKREEVNLEEIKVKGEGGVSETEIKCEEKSKLMAEEIKSNPKEKEEEIKCEKPEPKNSESKVIHYNFKRNGEYNKTQEKAINDAVSSLTKVAGYLYPLIALMMKKKLEHPDKFKEWGINCEAKLFTLYIQNKLETKNSKRRESFAENKHMNPWTQAKEFIEFWHTKSIKDEINTQIETYKSVSAKMDGSEKANIFAYSDNLFEAAGALMGTRIGSGRIRDFHAALCEGKALFIEEKVRMLVSGHHEGVKLYADMHSWNIGKKNNYKLNRAYPNMVFLYC